MLAHAAHSGRIAWRRVLRSVVWPVLILAHAPAWIASTGIGAGGGELDVLRFCVLSVTQAVFFLKLLDVAWLRVPQTTRAWVVVTLGVALLHTGAVRRAIDPRAEYAEPEPVAALLVIGAAVLAAGIAPRSLRALQVRARALRNYVHNLVYSFLLAFQRERLPERFLLLARGSAADAIPPPCR